MTTQDIITALLCTSTVKEAARALNCSEKTMRRHKQRPEVQKALRDALTETAAENARRLAAGASKAIETLESVMQDKGTAANTRIRAAALYLQIGLQYRQCTELSEQLDELRTELDELRTKADGKRNQN